MNSWFVLWRTRTHNVLNLSRHFQFSIWCSRMLPLLVFVVAPIFLLFFFFMWNHRFEILAYCLWIFFVYISIMDADWIFSKLIAQWNAMIASRKKKKKLFEMESLKWKIKWKIIWVCRSFKFISQNEIKHLSHGMLMVLK